MKVSNLQKALCLIVSLIVMGLTSAALGQTAHEAAGHVPQGLQGAQKEQTLWVYGFYAAYMNGVMYTPGGDMADFLRKEYVSHKLLKKTVQEMADVLIDGQDVVEINLQTLFVRPLADGWFEVSFKWPDRTVKVDISLQKKGRSYVITDVRHHDEAQ